MTSTRDYELGEALKNIATEPGESFFDDLDALIAQEPTPVTTLHSRRNTIRWIGAGSIAAAAAITAVMLLSINSSFNKYNPPATSKAPSTADVIALASSNFASTQNIQAQIEYSRSSRDTATSAVVVESHNYNAVLSNDGDFSLTDTNGAIAVYSAKTGSLLECPAGKMVTCNRDNGLTASDPRTRAADRVGLDRLLSLLRSGMPNAQAPQATTFEGRDVWKIDLTYSDNPIVNPAYATKDVRTEVLVDKELNFPLQAVTTVAGKPYETVTLRNLRTSAANGPSFSTDPPAGDSVRSYPSASKRIPLESATGLPTSIPNGFVASEASIDNANNLTTVTYRMGLQQFTLTMRPTPSSTDFLFDSAFTATSAEATLSESKIVLSDGRFNRETLHVRISTTDLKAYAIHGDQLVTAEGDIDSNTATAIFNSFSG